jgi:hypothetical protein
MLEGIRKKDIRKVKNKLPKLSLESEAKIHYQFLEHFAKSNVVGCIMPILH